MPARTAVTCVDPYRAANRFVASGYTGSPINQADDTKAGKSASTAQPAYARRSVIATFFGVRRDSKIKAATTPIAMTVNAPNGLIPYVIPAKTPAAHSAQRDPVSRQVSSACMARMTKGTEAKSVFAVVADHVMTGDANRMAAATTPTAVDPNQARENATSASTHASAPPQAMSFAPTAPNSTH